MVWNPSSQVVEVLPPEKREGKQLSCPRLLISDSNQYRATSESDRELYVDVVVHCLCVEKDIVRYGETRNVRLTSLFNSVTEPVVQQEARMTLVGSFVHKYNKQIHYVYIEDVFGSRPQTVAPIGSPNSSGRTVVYEESLTRSIT